MKKNTVYVVESRKKIRKDCKWKPCDVFLTKGGARDGELSEKKFSTPGVFEFRRCEYKFSKVMK
jgi:hypothetical protein